MKQVTGWFLVVLLGLALSLGACSSDDDPESSSSDDTEATDTEATDDDDGGGGGSADDGASSSEGGTASPELCQAFAEADFEALATSDLFPEDLSDDFEDYADQITAYAEDSTNNPLPSLSDDLIAYLAPCVEG